MAKPREQLFDQVLRDYGPMLGRIAAAYEFDPELQRDLVQDIALAIWQALPKFEGRSSLKTFVARIAHYRGVSHGAREMKTPKPVAVNLHMPAAGPSVEEIVGDELKRRKLLGIVRRLPLNLRQAATLALEGFEAREIAETLGISANNAAVRLNRAKNAIRKELQQ